MVHISSTLVLVTVLVAAASTMAAPQYVQVYVLPLQLFANRPGGRAEAAGHVAGFVAGQFINRDTVNLETRWGADGWHSQSYQRDLEAQRHERWGGEKRSQQSSDQN
jgi:hypothetical protein